MSAWDGLVVMAFAVYAIAAGLRARRSASRNLEEYFLAGRTLRGWKAGLSMAATQFAADTPLLVTGLIATAGVFALWRLWIYAIAFLLLGFVLAPSWRRAGVLTDAELTELRYAARPAAALRGIKAVYFGTIFNCTVLAMVLFAAAAIAEPFLVWHQWLPSEVFDPIVALVRSVGVPFTATASFAMGDPGAAILWTRSADNVISLAAIIGVTTLYSTTGGLRGVVNTDLLQLAIMLTATAIYAAIVVDAVGGLDAIPAGIRERFASGGPGGISPDEILAFTPSRARDAGLAVLAVFGLQWLVQMNADGTGYLAQRTMACRSDRDAIQASIVFVAAQILVRSLLWLPIGLGLLLIFPPDPGVALSNLAAEREVTYVRGMVELLPTGVRGLLFTAMLAAIASTLDSHLNWGSSYWTRDLYQRFWCRWRGKTPSDRSLVWVARASNLGILAIALAIMTQLDSIQVAWQLSLLLGAGMGVLLVLRWIWWRVNAWGEIAAVGASLVLAPVLLLWLPADLEAVRLLVLAAGSTLAGVATSLATRPEPEDRLREFYRRARPPGYWGPVAAAIGEDPRDGPRRLWRGLAATGIGAVSVFSLLTGLGSWIAGSPEPLGWPIGRAAWLACVTATGALLAPVAWRLGFKASRG